MRNSRCYAAATPDGMVDISSGKAVFEPVRSGGGKHNKNNNNKKGGKGKVAVIISVAVVLAAAMGVTGFCLMKNKPAEETKQEEVNKEFTYPGTVISGVDVTGRTLPEAKKLLELKKDDFIKPVKIDIDIEGETVSLTQNDFQYTYDIDEVLEKAKREAENPSGTTASTVGTNGKTAYEVTATVTNESISHKADSIGEEYNREAVDAYVTKFHPYSDNRFEYADEIEGYTIDTNDLKNQFVKLFASGNNYGSLTAQGENTTANVSKSFLQKNIVKLATYSTVSYNSEAGTNNMKVALEACNGSIIDPNKIWSFNECTGDSNKEENGYQGAGVIVKGEFTTGIGGGICQASSTIYNSAIRSNMTIDTRYCHQFASAYVPTGLDATIDYPRLDLKLQNTSGYQMFLECKVEGTTLYATFWGYQSDKYDEIRTKNKLESTGEKTYKVRAWRVYYKDGKQVDEQELFESVYDYSGGGATFIDAAYDSGAENSNDTSDAVVESSNQDSGSQDNGDYGDDGDYTPEEEPEPVESEAAEPEEAPQDGGEDPSGDAA